MFIYYLTNDADDVEIKIYTVSGRLIRKLDKDDGVGNATGYNEAEWDGMDEGENAVANGVYLYKVIATKGEGKVEGMGKLVVMK